MILFNIAQEQEKFNGKFKIKIDEGTLIDEGGLENNLFEVDVYLEMENVEEKDNYLKDEIKESLTSISNFSTKCETSYLRKYNFDVYEPSIKKKIKKSSKDYFE